MPLGLLGKKLGSARVYNASGALIPVTVVLAGPNRVLQVKTQAGKDGYNAVQLGFGNQKPQRIAKPALGHLVKHGALDKAAADKSRDKGDKTALVGVMKIKEFRNFSKDVKPGDLVGPTLFAPGDFIDAIGITKGRGFEGVMKRHNFGGGPATHGHKGWHRRVGAIGQRLFPGTVLRGFKMPGHMGQVKRTTQNLEVIQVREADNLLLIKGAIPGSEGDYVVIRESKKRPKGWKPPVSLAPMKRKGAAEKKPAAAPAAEAKK
jgi:large subunit ribosomal protein L3